MTDDEAKQLIKDLSTSPDYIHALSAFYDDMDGTTIDIHTLGLWFFSQGYLSCIEFQEKQKMTRPYKYNPKV